MKRHQHRRSSPLAAICSRGVAGRLLLLLVLVTASCDGDLNPIISPTVDAATDLLLTDSTTDVSPTESSVLDQDLPDATDAGGDGPKPCLSLAGQVCRTAVCSGYISCTVGLGTCGTGKFCCEGACTEKP